MKHSLLLTAVAIFFLASCTPPFKKVEQGMEYKIITDGKSEVIKDGYFFEFSFSQRFKGANKDTVYQNSKDFANQIIPLDSAGMPPVYYKMFKQLRKGDSLIIKQISDSFLVQGGPQVPPFIKKNGTIFTNLKVINIFKSRDAADSAYKAQMALAQTKDSIKSAEQLVKDDKTIKDYLAKNNIQAVKAPMGTYVQIINPGEGDVLDTSKVVKVKYLGKTLLGGKIFDSNTDPASPKPPYPVYLGAPAGSSVIKGWTDGILLLKKGSKANLYIPSSLGYGSRGNGEIKPNDILFFEVEIVDAIPFAQAKAEAEADRKKMEAEQKAEGEKMKKAQEEAAKKAKADSAKKG
jgi:FKBP-type peptidyl-prolyl cis-trans isomerase FkpA